MHISNLCVCAFGFSVSVLSWTGGENSIDHSSEAEERRGHRKTVRDHWDQELDKGKVRSHVKGGSVVWVWLVTSIIVAFCV